VTAGGLSISPRVCVACGAQLAQALLACPSCGQLVHAAELKQLAAEAAGAEAGGDTRGALEKWRRMLELLPPQSTQHAGVLAKVQVASAAVAGQQPRGAAGPSAAGKSSGSKKAAGIGAVGVLLAKFKWVILALLGKGKVLLVGLAQAKTFLSMGIALAVYASFYGWKFGLGLIASIYVHEMGHVVWLRRYGIAATAPMFIPGFGAFVGSSSTRRPSVRTRASAWPGRCGARPRRWRRWPWARPSTSRSSSRSPASAPGSTSSTCFRSGSWTAAGGSRRCRAGSAAWSRRCAGRWRSRAPTG
jgi:hypothetical protein